MIFMAASLASATQGLAEDCQCLDRGDIMHRIREAETAIAAYTRESTSLQVEEGRTNTVIKLTPKRIAEIQGHVQKDLDDLAARSGRISTRAVGVTDRFSLCIPAILDPSASECMKQAISVHEAVHQKRCLTMATWGSFLFPVGEYLAEETSAYTAEMAFLRDQLAKLPCDYKVDKVQVDPSSGWKSTFQTLKCDGPVGDWVYKLTTRGAGIDLKSEWRFRIAKGTLDGTYQSKLRILYNKGTPSFAQCDGSGRGNVRFSHGEKDAALKFFNDRSHSECTTPGTTSDFSDDLSHLPTGLEYGDFCP